MTELFNELSQVITVAGFGVCLLSLVVGGIGILNIMLVSVTERTQGDRHPQGAGRAQAAHPGRSSPPRRWCCRWWAGLIGVALGFGLAFLGRWMLGFPTGCRHGRWRCRWG